MNSFVYNIGKIHLPAFIRNSGYEFLPERSTSERSSYSIFVFKGKNTELITVSKHAGTGEWLYKNNKNAKDTGNVIDFLKHRGSNEIQVKATLEWFLDNSEGAEKYFEISDNTYSILDSKGIDKEVQNSRFFRNSVSINEDGSATFQLSNFEGTQTSECSYNFESFDQEYFKSESKERLFFFSPANLSITDTAVICNDILECFSFYQLNKSRITGNAVFISIQGDFERELFEDLFKYLKNKKAKHLISALSSKDKYEDTGYLASHCREYGIETCQAYVPAGGSFTEMILSQKGLKKTDSIRLDENRYQETMQHLKSRWARSTDEGNMKEYQRLEELMYEYEERYRKLKNHFYTI